jgi:hypothetical protein
MKTVLLCILFLTGSFAAAARDKNDSLRSRFYVSAGAHLGFWAKDGQNGVPFNFQADVLVTPKLTLGVLYTYDSYKGNPGFFNVRTRPGPVRQNVSIRMCNYFIDPANVFSLYIGCSAGLSVWEVRSGGNLYPTAQFLFGLKLQVINNIFWLTEFGAGPPYICQSSLGINF